MKNVYDFYFSERTVKTLYAASYSTACGLASNVLKVDGSLARKAEINAWQQVLLKKI